MSSERYDYVVVGGGSSGCVLAATLSDDPEVSVLLLEHGDSAEDHEETLIADRYKDAFIHPELLFERFSTVDSAWGDRRLFQGSGRGLGGGGSVNAMVYTRGAKADYDEWPEGWRWSDVLGSFEEIESRLRPRKRGPTEFSEAFIDGAVEAGFRRSEDLNDGDLSGVLGYEWMNFEGEDRRSSYVAYLRPARSRPNLEIRTNAVVHRLTFDARGRISGVEYAHAGANHRAETRQEVVMCAGALETPRILQLSGIGSGHALRRVGLPVHAELDGVGENLHDHPNVTLFFKSQRPIDVKHPQVYGFHRANPASRLPKGQSDTCYVMYPARSSLREGMMRILPGLMLPEALYDVDALPKLVRSGVSLAFQAPALRDLVEHIYGVVVILGKPMSRGRVSLRSSDPHAPAVIDPAYFRDPEDLETLLRGIDLARNITKSTPLASFGKTELMPGPLGRDRAGVESWVKKNVMTTYHYAGTCRMGEDRGAVLDTRLRVRGVPGLRVADASAIPSTPVSAMNAPSMLVGYRGARFIQEERAMRKLSSSAEASTAS